MRPQLDQLYVYRSSTLKMLGSFKKLNQRVHDDYKYRRGNVLEKGNDVYRYALTIKIGNNERTLLLVTFDNDPDRLEKFFKDAKNQIKSDDKMLNIFTICESKPELLGISYVY